MNRLIKFAIVFALILNSKYIMSETRTFNFPYFNGIDVSHGLSVIVKFDTLQRVLLESNDNNFNAVSMEVKNRTLIIRKKLFGNGGNTKIVVYTKYLEKLVATAGSEIKCEHEIISDYLNCKAKSGSKLTFTCQCKYFEGEFSGGSNINAKGEILVGKISSSSGANFNGKELNLGTTYLEASTGSNLELRVTDFIGGSINTGANVTITGKPSNHITCKSGGNIRIQ